jgi:2-aminoadipate transaminase
VLSLGLLRGPGSQRLFRQIRDHIRSAILAGELGPDVRLPAERELARALRVNRLTVVRAYQELAAEGLVMTSGSRGTLVAPLSGGLGPPDRAGPDGAPEWLIEVAAHRLSRLGPDPTLLQDLTVSGSRPGVIPLAAAGPTPGVLPVHELSDSLAEALRMWGEVPLTYGPVEGLDQLRHAIRERFLEEVIGEADDVLVVSGATQGIEVTARALIEPGDEVVVEAPAYFGSIQAFRMAGAQVIGVPVDHSGLRVDLVERLLSRRRVRLIAVQPTFQNPTGVTMSAARREHLLALSRRHAVPILEDDPYRLLSGGSPAPFPLKRMDRHGSVIYVGSFSKSVSPGLRLAWVAAHRAVLPRLVLSKQFSDLNSGGLAQAALARFIASGRYDQHLVRSAPVYRERRLALLEQLATQAPGVHVPWAPEGGFHLWARLPAPGTARAVVAAGVRLGVSAVAGAAFYPESVLGRDLGHDYLRLSFPQVAPEAAAEGVRRLARAIAEVSGAPSAPAGTSSPVLV